MTRLDKPLRREIRIGDKAYTVTLTPLTMKLAEKGHRNGVQVYWADLVCEGAGRTTAQAHTGYAAKVLSRVSS